MDNQGAAGDLTRRLAWLLVFRGAVATALLVMMLAAEVAQPVLRHVSAMVYGVVIGTFVAVLVLGLVLRTKTSPVVLSAVHIAVTVMAAVIMVQGTGGVHSSMSFLYLLVILDGAIIGARQVALAVASSCSLAYGLQLLTQMYGWIPAGDYPPASGSEYITSAVVHVAAYYLVALLAGYLAALLASERAAASTAQLDLRRVERLQRVVVESLPVGVITIDTDLVIVTANARAAEIVGTPSSALRGGLLPEQLAAFVDGDADVIELEFIRAGEPRHLYLSRSPVAGIEEEASALEVLVIEDRTELRALQSDLDAKARLASLGELGAAIAHEIRNPLAAISGAVELLAPAPDGDDRVSKLQAIVSREIGRLNRLLNDFLGYARPMPPQIIKVDLAALGYDLANIVRQDTEWSDHPLTLSGPGELRAEVDPEQMRQVLWNLLRNAVEASPAGSEVELMIERVGSDLVIEVRDTGAGIEDSIRDHLFEPFRTTKHGGTGLGLAVVHRIVDAHGGTIAVESGPEDGTTMRVVIPGAACEASAARTG